MREGPVVEIAEVGEDVRGGSRGVADSEGGEGIGSATQGFAAAISDGGESVAKEFASGMGGWVHESAPGATEAGDKVECAKKF